MSFVREFGRTIVILVSLVVLLGALIVIPGEEQDEKVPMLTNVKARLDTPTDGKCYLSVGLMHTEGATAMSKDVGRQIDAFSSLVGKNQSVYIDTWGDLWEKDEAYWQLEKYKPLLASGKVDALGINLWPCVRSDHANDNYTVVQIARGEHDEFIRAQAAKVKEFQFPLFIRFGAEFNIYQGERFEGQTKEGTYIFADDPTNFIAAWRHYVDVFREENVSNAIFMWNPNFADFGPHHFTEYYPGDDYVDWVGIDIYQYEPTSSPRAMLSEAYGLYSDRKPIAVAEWGTNWKNQDFSDADRARFVHDLFDAVESMPAIKMINYWYYEDYRFNAEDYPLTTAAYRERAADPRYIGP